MPTAHSGSHLDEQNAANDLQLLSKKVIRTNQPLNSVYQSPASIHLQWPAMLGAECLLIPRKDKLDLAGSPTTLFSVCLVFQLITFKNFNRKQIS